MGDQTDEWTEASTAKAGQAGLFDLAGVSMLIERLSMVKGLEATDDAASFVTLCSGERIAPDRAMPLRRAGLVTEDLNLTAQGIAVRNWLGL